MKDGRTRRLALTHYFRTLILRLIYVMQHGDPERHTPTGEALPAASHGDIMESKTRTWPRSSSVGY